MKKLTIIFLSIFYLLLSTGVRVNAHYCGDKLSSISFFDYASKSCCGVKEVENKCCKDKVTFLKLSDSQEENPSFLFTSPEFSEALVPSFRNVLPSVFFPEILVNTNDDFLYEKVVIHKVSFFIINRSFRV